MNLAFAEKKGSFSARRGEGLAGLEKKKKKGDHPGK